MRLETHKNTEPNETNNPTPITTTTIPYTQGTAEAMARILQPYNIRRRSSQAHHYFTYIGETSRNLNTRLAEHKGVTKDGDIGNHIA